jgi:hypothetical protein
MPIALEPNQRFPVVLDSDAEKPAESRPTFFSRSLTMREQQRLSEEMDESIRDKTTQQIFDATCELLKKYLVGWSNMGAFAFEDCDLASLLSHNEARELLRKILANQFLQHDEKKV